MVTLICLEIDYGCFCIMGFPGGSVVKNLPTKARNVGLIPGLGRSPGEGNGNPLQYSCLGNLKSEKSGGLQSRELQSVGHDLLAKQ